MMSASVPALVFERAKDADETKTYGVDWSADLGGSTITASAWAVVSGSVIIEDDAFTTTTTTVQLSGGVNGTPALVRNDVTLANGDELQQTCRLYVKSR